MARAPKYTRKAFFVDATAIRRARKALGVGSLRGRGGIVGTLTWRAARR
jgi:hypothetical protein